MDTWRNVSGLPLSGSAWLQDHHRAKLREREAFANRVADLKPRKVIDLGCATGLWLELLNRALPENCEFIGIDADASAVEEARDRSRHWTRRTTLLRDDVETCRLPVADTILCFNMLGYFRDPAAFLRRSKSALTPKGTFILRQYDAATMRLGRMDHEARVKADLSLHANVGSSHQFNHYAMDATLEAISKAGYASSVVEFDAFYRVSPFPHEFIGYLDGSIEWMVKHISDESGCALRAWLADARSQPLHYFLENDLICWLSS